MKFYIIGERELVLAFKLTGIEGCVAENRAEVLDAFNRVTGKGGVVNVPSGEIPRGAWKEFLVAAAGPLSSLALGFGMFFFLYGSGVEIESRWLDSVLSYFGIMNFMLGLFNLLPGFPMDGGRMFRSAMRAFMSRERATYTAVVVGRAAAIALVVLPFFGINSIWIIPIGGDLVFRVLIAFMIWREGYREYLLAKMESSWDYSDYRARVSPPPYGGKEDDVDVKKN